MTRVENIGKAWEIEIVQNLTGLKGSRNCDSSEPYALKGSRNCDSSEPDGLNELRNCDSSEPYGLKG